MNKYILLITFFSFIVSIIVNISYAGWPGFLEENQQCVKTGEVDVVDCFVPINSTLVNGDIVEIRSQEVLRNVTKDTITYNNKMNIEKNVK